MHAHSKTHLQIYEIQAASSPYTQVHYVYWTRNEAKKIGTWDWKDAPMLRQ